MGGEAVSGTRYEVRCSARTESWFDAEDEARSCAVGSDEARWLDCGPHRVWSVDPDGTQTDITDERCEVVWTRGVPVVWCDEMPLGTRYIGTDGCEYVMCDPTPGAYKHAMSPLVAWPDGATPTPPSSTEGADPWAALKALPEWQTFARTWGEARPRTVCTFCEGSGEVEDEGWSPEFYPQERRYRDGIIDCGWCGGDGWRYVDRDDAAEALVAAVEGGKGA